MYKDITEFRKAFDLPVNNHSDLDIELHESLLLEELEELADAKTDIEILDAIIDAIYIRIGYQVNAGAPEVDCLINTLYKLALRKGYDFESAWDIVHASNMSKLCVTMGEAKATAGYYKDIGYSDTVIENVENYFTVKNAEDVTLSGGKYVKAGKVLKSILYAEANLTECIGAIK